MTLYHQSGSEILTTFPWHFPCSVLSHLGSIDYNRHNVCGERPGEEESQ